MAQVRKSIVKEVEVKELQIGDTMLADMIGYKDHILFHRGQVLNARDIRWINKKLKEGKPQLSAERIMTERKANVDIKTKSGRVLVKTNEKITEDALKPLLKEGFTSTPLFGSPVVMFSRPVEWGKDRDYHITDFNPTVKIETMVTINADIQEVPEGMASSGSRGRAGGSRS